MVGLESLCQIFGCETLVLPARGRCLANFVRCAAHLHSPLVPTFYSTIGKTSAALVFRCSPFVQCPCQAFIRPPKCYVTFAILHSNKFNRITEPCTFFAFSNRHIVSICKTFVANFLIDAQILMICLKFQKAWSLCAHK